MKALYTNGVGNQQTLTNAQDEKIVIYDTLADAQSDLANLEEGQIIGTKGTFFQMSDTTPIGSIIAYYGSTDPDGWFICDGRDTTGTNIQLNIYYPHLYSFLGNSNILPDLRECVPVGVGQNITDSIANHDVYTLGQFKDDQMQKIEGTFTLRIANTSGFQYSPIVDEKSGVFNTSGNDRPTLSSFGNPTADVSTKTQIKLDSSTTTRTSITNVTHGKQKGVNWIIKAKMSNIAPMEDNALYRDDLVDEVTEDVMEPVTSNAVFDYKTDTVTSGSDVPITSGAVANALGGTALKYKDIDFYMSNITFSQLANRVGYYSNLLKSDYFSNTDVILSAMIIKWSSVPIAIFCFDNNTNNISIQCSDITYDTSATAYWTVRFVYIEN